ncbi:unnamed protein product [Meloidogyne enterolobii]|uniref:Uncharacterized protein n=1 Tax=Meloidogyne enterolobii TaxID=390850 RepID=A0ACB0YL69_MELEN
MSSLNNNTTTNNSVTKNSPLNILDKVKQFLPQIAEANEKLKNDETKGSVLIEKFEEESSNVSENETSSSEDSDEESNEDFCDSDDELQPKLSNEESKQFVQFDVHLFEEEDGNNKGRKLVMETSTSSDIIRKMLEDSLGEDHVITNTRACFANSCGGYESLIKEHLNSMNIRGPDKDFEHLIEPHLRIVSTIIMTKFNNANVDCHRLFCMRNMGLNPHKRLITQLEQLVIDAIGRTSRFPSKSHKYDCFPIPYDFKLPDGKRIDFQRDCNMKYLYRIRYPPEQIQQMKDLAEQEGRQLDEDILNPTWKILPIIGYEVNYENCLNDLTSSYKLMSFLQRKFPEVVINGGVSCQDNIGLRCQLINSDEDFAWSDYRVTSDDLVLGAALGFGELYKETPELRCYRLNCSVYLRIGGENARSMLLCNLR